MAYITLDQHFQSFPAPDRDDDFFLFWEKVMADTRRISLDTESSPVSGGPSGYNGRRIIFRGAARTLVKARLYLPVKKDRPRVVIVIHDYNREPSVPQAFPDRQTAWLFLTLRGHDPLPVSETPEVRSPGYFSENLLDRDMFYARLVYSDVIRCLDMVRLMPDLDSSTMALYGKGFGAAAALYAAAFSDRIAAIALDTPYFCNLPLSQNTSSSEAAAEINEFIEQKKARKKTIKDNLSYFDAINVADRIKCPVMVTMGYKDTLAPGECIMGLFNLLPTEKTIEVFPEDGHDAGGEEQRMKTFKWLSTCVNRERP